jgi:hypothetical protein
MSRLGTLFWLTLVLVTGFATFKVKYAVQDIEQQLARARKQTLTEQQEIRVLTAEWTYLNQPERLANLNQRFLGLVPVAAKQLQTRIEDIPLRAPDLPAATDALVAANPAPAAPQSAVPPVTIATLSAAADDAPPRLQLAKAAAPHSLDALIAQIAEAR